MPSVAASGRADLTDAQWARWGPLLPRGKKSGRPPKWTKRQLIDGIRWRIRTGSPWRDVSVDSTIARAHQHAAGARRDGDGQVEPPGGVDTEPADYALGRSRGGWTTKTHLACEQGRKPLSIVVTAGQCGDSPQFATVLDVIRVPRVGRGRPRCRPDAVLADKAYSSAGNRGYLRKRGIRATIPVKSDQAANRKKKGPAGGRPRTSTASTTSSVTRSSAVSAC